MKRPNEVNLELEDLSSFYDEQGLNPKTDTEKYINKLEQRLEAGQHETIVMRWEKGQPPTDDDGNSLPVMGKILHNGNYHVAPVNLWNYKWHWIESGKKMSEDFTVIEWMYYPNA